MSFDFENWRTPAALDTDAFKVVARQEDSVSFHHVCNFQNYSGTLFRVGIDRSISMLQKMILRWFGRNVPEGLEYVGYKTDNQITNRGKETWKAENGLLSI